MTSFWNWIVSNLSNIFSVLGIILTLYFGIYYVPSWLKDAQEEKILNAQRNLQQSIKEIVYSDSIFTFKEIAILIKAKELELNQPYPYTPEELLTQVEESFVQDRFLPLSKRKELIAEIELLKLQVPKVIASQELKSESKKSVSILQWISIIISIFTVSIGILSFYLKFKSDKAKDEEIGNQMVESNINFSNQINGLTYQNQMLKAIQNYPNVRIIEYSNQHDYGFDAEFIFKNVKYFVEIKYLTRSKVGLSSFNDFIFRQKGLEGIFLFIYNTDLTEMVKKRAAEINKITQPQRHIVLIKAENGNDLRNQLNKLLQNI